MISSLATWKVWTKTKNVTLNMIHLHKFFQNLLRDLGEAFSLHKLLLKQCSMLLASTCPRSSFSNSHKGIFMLMADKISEMTGENFSEQHKW